MCLCDTVVPGSAAAAGLTHTTQRRNKWEADLLLVLHGAPAETPTVDLPERVIPRIPKQTQRVFFFINPPQHHFILLLICLSARISQYHVLSSFMTTLTWFSGNKLKLEESHSGFSSCLLRIIISSSLRSHRWVAPSVRAVWQLLPSCLDVCL